MACEGVRRGVGGGRGVEGRERGGGAEGGGGGGGGEKRTNELLTVCQK